MIQDSRCSAEFPAVFWKKSDAPLSLPGTLLSLLSNLSRHQKFGGHLWTSSEVSVQTTGWVLTRRRGSSFYIWLKIQNIVKSPTRKQLIGPDKVRGKKGARESMLKAAS
jgi:hypothetical protein